MLLPAGLRIDEVAPAGYSAPNGLRQEQQTTASQKGATTMEGGISRWMIVALGTCVWPAAASMGAELPVTAGLELRLDAASFANRRLGSAVSEWPDTSGNQRHATGGSGGAIYGEVQTPSGLYAVSFHDVCDEAMSFCYNPNGRDITVIGVARSRLEASVWPYYFRGFIGWREVAGETPLALGSFNITQTVVALSGYGEAGLNTVIVATHVPATGFTVDTARLNSTTGVLDVFRNKRPLGQLSGIKQTIQGAAPCGFIGGLGACDGLGWAGELAEVLVYSRALTDAEREAVESYLHDKWLLAFKAYNPNPADEAVDVVPDLPTWSSGHTARLHELYLGATSQLGPENLLFSGSYWPPQGFKTPDWQPSTTYFWRVDEVEADRANVYTGDVWSFTTAPSTAHGPSPRDGAKFVDPNTQMSWQSGMYMVAHDIYFGPSRQAVLDKAGWTYRGRRETTTLDPGRLIGDITYYWKIDEIAADGRIYPGPLWSFTTLGLGGGVKGEYFDNMSRFGDPVLTRVDPGIDFFWGDGSPDPDLEPDYFSVLWTGDLEPVFTDDYTFTVRTNGYVSLWVDDVKLVERRLLTSAAVEDKGTTRLTAGRVYPIRLEYEVGQGEAMIQLFWQSRTMARQIVPAGSLQPPLRARDPFPANKAIETQNDLTLRWTAGWKATHHDVYFGPDADTIAEATPASKDVYLGRLPADLPQVRTGPLDWNRTYYWRIDEVNEAEIHSPWAGNVWSFTTANFIPIDDFESYTDEDGSRIYETWTDGWINGTGSTIGYAVSGSWPIRVHRGEQSMPFDYNNARIPHYSETERVWSTPQDWTAHGAAELSLWFAGAPVSFRETPEGSIVISGSGGEMECAYDPYRFVYRRLDGDGTITARIDSLTNAQGWARAGVMIADAPDTGSQYAILAATGGYGLLFGCCPYDSEARVQTLHEGVEIPCWVRLTREGNRLTAATSQDGSSWSDVVDIGGQPVVLTMDLPQQVYVGLCVSSHRPDVIATAELSQIAFSGSVSGSWKAAQTEMDQPGNSQDKLYVALSDSKGKIAIVTHPNPGAVNLPDWTRWTIPLSQFAQAGVNLASIRRLYLGVGDRTNPKPSGSGMIYIDDIRVTAGP
jgi:hypothetical protein